MLASPFPVNLGHVEFVWFMHGISTVPPYVSDYMLVTRLLCQKEEEEEEEEVVQQTSFQH